MSANSLFPLIRRFSRPVTGVLVRFPVSANQVTAMSFLVGLAAAWAAAQGTWGASLASGFLLFVAYVLDHCDGEIAQFKNQCSPFGMHFDSFVDWIVHAAFFWGLGVGVTVVTGKAYWNWLGLAAAAGATINYFIGFFHGIRDVTSASDDPDQTWRRAPDNAQKPQTTGEWILFVFRELTRADFCFIVLALAAFDVLWVLLPAGAVGAQVYWMTALIKQAREFHV
ncbi:MAG: CDP-alcohol phosphatidyltransferase family protein [Acidimicrobiia bacterium]|nr:CDP-alcohol phosphatidyltransferase family protein [Acidimicrobiia bacterium]